ncbi:MAG: hypothetical protein NBV67_00845 [Tagaea sp.]|nr:hypothetical protein [Tagaea sp.]
MTDSADEAGAREIAERDAFVARARRRPSTRVCVLCGEFLAQDLIDHQPDALDCGGGCGKGTQA